MILGDLCTRACAFCAVATARKGRPLREEEGEEIAAAAAELGLDYVVLTSVDRDDLPDRGALHFARCIRAVKTAGRGAAVEALIPDYHGEELTAVIRAGPEVIAHNVETVRSLQAAVRDRRADFDKSLRTLREAAEAGLLTKSSILLGLGETEEEVLSAMDELRRAGTAILVLGQYLRPSPRHLPVVRYLSPEDFSRLGEAALSRGFSSVISSPLARTSYHAREKLVDARAGNAVSGGAGRGNPRRVETMGRPPGCKLIRLSAAVEGGIIRSLSIRGDFFASPEAAFDRVEARMAGTALAEAGRTFDSLLAEEGVQAFGVSGAGVAELLMAALGDNTPPGTS
jgi:lipoic acid synthetase